MFCEQCGSELKENGKFCERCGFPVNGGENGNVRTQINTVGQPVYYGGQPQIIVQAPKKGFNFFHFFVGAALVIFGIVFIGVAVFLVKTIQSAQPTAEQLQAQADADAANQMAAQERELFNAVYSMYCGTYEIEKVRNNGVWENYNTVGEVVGFLVDFRNLYEFGSQTNMYSAPTITLSPDSVDLTSLGLGVYSTEYFHYEQIGGMDYFIDDLHGMALFYDGPYLYLGYQNEQGAWQGECAFQ